MKNEIQAHINEDTQKDIKQLFTHAEIANKEMGDIKKEMGDINVNIAKIFTDVNWIMKFFWVIATSAIGGLIASVFNLLQ